MKATLIQQGLAEALIVDPKKKEEEGDEKSPSKKGELMEKAHRHSAFVLRLSDKVQHKVWQETSAWGKQEKLYITKSLGDRLYKTQKLYSYRFEMTTG